MRLNCAFTGFFTNRFVVSSGIAIMTLAIFFTASSFRKPSDRDLRVKQVNLIIRQIGHRLLLQAGDSTSRVLPVTEKEGTFLLQFENEFAFSHDSLMVLSNGLLPKTQFPSGYTVTVHDCKKGEIVYGFQLNNASPDILACGGRKEPRGCYTIEFAFPDFYKNVEQKKAGIDQLTASVQAAPQEVNPKFERFKKTTSDYDTGHWTEEPESVKVDSPEANPKIKEFKKTNFDHPSIILIGSGVLVVLSVALLVGRFRKNLRPVPVQNQNDALMKEPSPEGSGLGKFSFDVKGQRLLLESEVISLTDKECKVLKLLHNNFGELISRDTLMQEVWINEGVITGRSLDMFISKLRKKLSADPELRITNVHGKGYRLEVVNEFTA